MELVSRQCPKCANLLKVNFSGVIPWFTIDCCGAHFGGSTRKEVVEQWEFAPLSKWGLSEPNSSPSNPKLKSYSYSTDQEIFYGLDSENYDEAIAEAIKLADSRLLNPGVGPVWVGENMTPPNPTLSFIEDNLTEEMHDLVGEVADEWPDLSKQESEAMYDELNQVLMKHLVQAKQWPPSFWQVVNVKQVR
jgi:hypothetical protein